MLEIRRYPTFCSRCWAYHSSKPSLPFVIILTICCLEPSKGADRRTWGHDFSVLVNSFPSVYALPHVEGKRPDDFPTLISNASDKRGNERSEQKIRGEIFFEALSTVFMAWSARNSRWKKSWRGTFPARKCGFVFEESLGLSRLICLSVCLGSLTPGQNSISVRKHPWAPW